MFWAMSSVPVVIRVIEALSVEQYMQFATLCLREACEVTQARQ